MNFIGIDVHKKQSQICVLDEQGEVCFETRVPTSREHLKDAVLIYKGAKILLESSTPSEWVARHFESMGMEVIVADPNFAPMYATRSKKLKTDKRDARCLAQACKLGAYKLAHRLSDEQRRVRMQLDVRQALVETRTKLTNQIGAVLLGYGYTVATGAAENYERRLGQLDLPPELRTMIAPLVTLLIPLNEQIDELDHQMEARADADPDAQRLQTIPGIGPLTSLTFLAVIDGAARFERAHSVMSYIGLVPREFSSGEKQLRGHITKAGSSRVRVMLVQAAQRIMRLKNPKTTALCTWAEGIAQRRGKRVAAVALARRLSGIMWAMLRDATEYEARSQRSAEQSREQSAPATRKAAPKKSRRKAMNPTQSEPREEQAA